MNKVGLTKDTYPHCGVHTDAKAQLLTTLRLLAFDLPGLALALALNVLAALLLTFGGFAIGRFYQLRKVRSHAGHLARLIPKEARVFIVLPEITVNVFEVQGQNISAHPPSNVHWMPVPEGLGVAKLLEAIKQARKDCSVTIVTPDNIPTNLADMIISLGGPSINSFTDHLVSTRFPSFYMEYPDHVGHFAKKEYRAVLDADRAVVSDYGFTFLTRINNVRCISFFGIRAFGSLIAVNTFLEADHHSPISEAVRGGNDSLIITAGNIHGLHASDYSVTGIYGAA